MQTDSNTLTPASDYGVFNASVGRFVLPALPFEITALSPVTGPDTLNAHLSKHHQSYVDQSNKLLEPMVKKFSSALDVIEFARATGAVELLEQSSQALNHAFFWACQQAAGHTRPEGKLEEAVNEAFGDFEGFIECAITLAKSRLGSGWLWVMSGSDGAVELILTKDTESCLDHPNLTALLVCDLWEHAYYLDRTSDRPGWVSDYFTKLADWKFAQTRYEAALGVEPKEN